MNWRDFRRRQKGPGLIDLQLIDFLIHHPLTPGGVLVLLNFIGAIIASSHVVMYKRDPRATLGWVGVIWLAPFIGPLLYWAFGINRVRRKALRFRGREPREVPTELDCDCEGATLAPHLSGHTEHLADLCRLNTKVTQWPLLHGNHIRPLRNGDEAYPVMLDAIRGAQKSIGLSSYIFDNDEVGREFVAELSQAKKRGVAVRVIVDAVGARYSWPSILSPLAEEEIPCASFMPSLLPWKFAYANLRSHRKLMVVDGHIGFTGGMNLRAECVLAKDLPHSIVDLHFEVRGPVIAHLRQIFCEDWEFCRGEALTGPAWQADETQVGNVPARGIPSGPDADSGKLRLALLGAIQAARRRIVIVTPYFLPDAAVVAALQVAALSGVQIDIILPSVCDQHVVQWASRAMWWQVLEPGCRVWLSSGPFDHTKLMIVDETWVLFGSGNWDQRSLRLNFEFNVECYDAELAKILAELVAEKLVTAREVTLAEVDARTIPVRLRDGVARLFWPYL
jgi:cardiolipin synthase